MVLQDLPAPPHVIGQIRRSEARTHHDAERLLDSVLLCRVATGAIFGARVAATAPRPAGRFSVVPPATVLF